MTVVGRLTRRTLERGMAGLLALLAGVVLFELVQAPVVDAIGGPRGLDALIERIPPALQAFARTRPEFLAMAGLPGYLSLGFTHPLYLVLTASAVVAFAARSLAGEMERGTLLLALARPVSRTQVYLSRVAGVVAICLLVAAAGPVGMIGGYLLAQPPGDLVVGHFLAVAANSVVLSWAIGGLSLLGSAAASTAGRVVGWGLALFVAMFFVDYFAGVWQIIEPFAFLSIYDYYDPTRALVTGSVSPANVLVLGLIGVAGTVGGLLIFANRDLPA